MVYCIILLMSCDAEQAPTALHFDTDASHHTSSLWLTSQLTEEIWNDAGMNYWNDLSESETKQLVSDVHSFLV